MSIDYYFGCRKHKKAVHVAQDGMSGFTFYRGELDCMLKLGQFLKEHSLGDCKVEFISEHQVDDGDYEEVEWRRM